MTNPAGTAPIWPLVASRPLPRLHVLSDLHLEHGSYEIPSDVEYDVLVAAGDIGPVEVSVPWLAALGKPVVYVLGNHERWGHDLQHAVALAKELAKGTQVHVLEQDSVVVQGVRFLGATLWTDLRRFQLEYVGVAARSLRDYEHVTCEDWLASPAQFKKLEHLCRRHKLHMPQPDAEGKLRLHPGIVYLENQSARKWLKRQLERRNQPPTVVVTHHAPTYESLLRNGITREQLQVQRWSYKDREPGRIAGYASEGLLEEVAGRRALLWVHGHTHSAMDYLESSTRVLCNPRGRPLKPLTEEDIRGYALFGVRLTSEDVQRSQEAHAKDPFRGDGRGFEKLLVVDFEHLMQRPLELACAEPTQKLQDLATEVENLIPHLGAGQSIPEKCVAEAVEHRLNEMESKLGAVKAQLLSQLDRYWDTSALQTVSAPHVPSIWDPFERAWRVTEQDVFALRTELTELLQWMQDLPTLPRRSIEAARTMASKGLKAARAAGYELQLRRFSPKALKRLDARDLVFFAVNEAAQAEDPEYRLDVVLDEALNGRKIPRQWLARVEVAEGQVKTVAARHLT